MEVNFWDIGHILGIYWLNPGHHYFVFLGSARGTVVTDFYWGTLVNDADFWETDHTLGVCQLYWSILVTYIDFGKMTVHWVIAGCTWGTLILDVDSGKMIIYYLGSARGTLVIILASTRGLPRLLMLNSGNNHM